MKDWLKEHIRTLTQTSELSEAEAQRLFHQSLYISIDPAFSENRNYQWAFNYALNLLSRMFPAIEFDQIADTSMTILPWGTTRPLGERSEPKATLVFGKTPQKIYRGPVITANCSDWRIYIDTPSPAVPHDPWNPVLALSTACYAAARVTKILLGDSVDGPSGWKPFSLLDYRTASIPFDWTSPLNVGQVYLGGVGAIGTAFLFGLSAHGKATGTLNLVDHDEVDQGNLGRYTLFDIYDVGKRKVNAAAKRLTDWKIPLSLNPIDQRFEIFFDSEQKRNTAFGISQLISAPDRRKTRRQFQSKLPQKVWDASTGPDQIILHHNSFDQAFACLSCIYPENANENAHFEHIAEKLGISVNRVMSGETIMPHDAKAIIASYPQLSEAKLINRAFDSVFRDLCSSGELRNTDKHVLAPFSFVSALAGVLLYFEFVKSIRNDVFESFQGYNYTQLNPWFPPNPDFRELRPSRSNCTCQDPIVRRVFSGIVFD